LPRFSLFEFKLGSKNYVLLPKLNSGQMSTIERELKERRFVIRPGQPMTAKRGQAIIKYDAAGLCWSESDLSDIMLPHIPELLASPKEEVPLAALKTLYFGIRTVGPRATIRLRPRLEGGPNWRELRRSGLCALAPDEHSVLAFLLEHASAPLNVITDFATEVSKSRIVSGRQLYEARIGAALVTSTLSSAEKQGTRNSYLPRDGALRLARFDPPSKQEYAELFEGLGEWCYFRAR
jgi:hypothetical protein